jgi:hypothetical protein
MRPLRPLTPQPYARPSNLNRRRGLQVRGLGLDIRVTFKILLMLASSPICPPFLTKSVCHVAQLSTAVASGRRWRQRDGDPDSIRARQGMHLVLFSSFSSADREPQRRRQVPWHAVPHDCERPRLRAHETQSQSSSSPCALFESCPKRSSIATFSNMWVLEANLIITTVCSVWTELLSPAQALVLLDAGHVFGTRAAANLRRRAHSGPKRPVETPRDGFAVRK